MAFTVVSQATITLTTTGSGIQPTDSLKASYILPTDDITRVELNGSTFSAEQYRQGRTFSLPSESIYLQSESTGEAKLVLTSLDGSCTGQESQVFTVPGLLLEEGGGGGGGGYTCNVYTTFRTGSTESNACNASTTTLYINGEYATLTDVPSNPIIYTDAGCTTRAGSTYISDGTVVRYWNNDDGILGDVGLC